VYDFTCHVYGYVEGVSLLSSCGKCGLWVFSSCSEVERKEKILDKSFTYEQAQ